MTLRTVPFDAADYLDDTESQTELLTDAFESGDASYIANALGIVARARGMTSVAKDAGVTREALYRSLSKDGDPRLTTLLGAIKALGLQLSVKPAP
jgi:probable addiction module antidote protein